MNRCEEMTILVPVTQYVRIEGAAAANSLSLDAAASFLLSKWVQATCKKIHTAAGSAKPAPAEVPRTAERVRKS